jgi:ribosomal protein S18 acetylase RimI-like enzyme
MPMSDEWMPTLKLKLSRQEFEQLPRHPAYKYELLEGVTHIAPWPRHCHAQLRLTRFRVPAGAAAETTLRPATSADIDALTPLLVGAFAHAQPFGSLSQADARNAAEKSLRAVFAGNDGPLAERASFVALDGDKIVGAILTTLLPGGTSADWDSYQWSEPAPPDLWAKRNGQPHLTWIFVKRWSQGTGIGTRLLQQTVRVLKKQGYATLWSTFLVGNDSSMRWHWRNGFELAENLLSKRRMRRELEGH